MRYVLDNIDYEPKGITKERLKPNTEVVSIYKVDKA
jgi:hypothetical protein